MPNRSRSLGETVTDERGDAAVENAHRVADAVLLPAADALDRSGAPPVAQLDALAAAGLYGMAGPASAGGSDCDLPTACEVISILAGACLTTTFVWIQHHGVVRALRGAPELADTGFLSDLCAGRRRAGVVLAGLKPGPSALRAVAAGDDGWVLEGEAPWFTGWGLVDVAFVAARTPEDQVLWAAIDLDTRDPTLRFTPAQMLAVQGSATGSLAFAGTAVPAARVLGVAPLGDWSAGGALRLNGALGLGVAGRCLTELGEDTAQAANGGCAVGDRGCHQSHNPLPSAAQQELERLRVELVGVADEAVASVRAQIAVFALRCAGARLAAGGSRGMHAEATAARRYREAGFLLTFGQRPAIRDDLLARLTAPAARSV